MSSEAIKHQFLFRTDSGLAYLESLFQNEGTALKDPPKLSRVGAFFHFDLHDLESLWWVAIWILIFNRDGENINEDGELYESLKELALKLFPRTHDAEDRHDFFLGLKVREQAAELMPKSFWDIIHILGATASYLAKKYTDFERNLPLKKWETLEGTQEYVSRAFDLIIPRATGVKLRPWAMPALAETDQKNTSSHEQQENRAPVDSERPSKEETGGLIPVNSEEGDEKEVENLVGGVGSSEIYPDEKDDDEEVEDMLL